jgi:glycopeptide antibiotics resistance protein
VVANLALFVPLGASIALYTQRAALVPTLAAAFVCSFAGEWAQVYSRNRFPSGQDLVCNVLGAVVAAYAVDRFREVAREGPKPRRLSRRPNEEGSSVAITYGVQAPPGRTNEGRITGVD